MQRRVFWISFLLLSSLTDLILPLTWGIVCTIPILFLCWWLAYRSEWFD